MCVTCADDVATDIEPVMSWSNEQVARVDEMIRLEGLERHRLMPKKYPICTRCERVFHAAETEPMYHGQCLFCGVNRLERLFFKLWKARGRKARRKAIRRIQRFARTGR
jgi:hypothetical protein